MRSVRAAVLALSFLASLAAFGATPVIVSIDPNTVVAGSPDTTITVNGANFVSGAVVRANGVGQTTTFVSASKLTAKIPANLMVNQGAIQITVTNPGTAASSAVTLTVAPNQPTITSLDPPTVATGNQPVDITINGTNFASTATVRVNNTQHGSTYISTTQMKVTLVASDLSKAGTLPVIVVNPSNKLSNSMNVTVTNGAIPTITLLNPSTINSGGPAFQLQVVGTNYVSTSQIKVNGALHATIFVDAQHLTTQISQSEILNPGSLSITVNNPNNLTSSPATLTVTDSHLPTITDISPTSVAQGSPGFILTITGTNFVTGTKVNVGSATPRNATIVDAQHLTVQIIASDIINQGSVPISVTTPAPNGGTSNVLNLTVTSKTAPVLTSLQPSQVAANSVTTKVIANGTGFKLDDIMQWDGAALPTEFISATQLAATVDATLLTATAEHQITVTRKDGTGTSAPQKFTVTGADSPTISSLSPETANVGGAPFTLVVHGTNFVSTSIVTLDDQPRDTTFVSTTELRIDMSAGDIATAHQYVVNVVNPGNLLSLDFPFVVSVPVPAITSITPDNVISGEGTFQLKVTGDNFSNNSIINVGGVAHQTSVQPSSGALITTVTDAEIAEPGSIPITVTENGVTSAPVILTSRRPAITSIEPGVVTLGQLSATIRVAGTAFLPTSKVIFKGNELQTSFNTDGSLTAIINGADLTSAGDWAVSVRNSPKSLSAPAFLTIASLGTPVISSVGPLTVGATKISVTGSAFVPLSVVRVNGVDRATTFISNTELSADLQPADTAGPGTFTVTVRNPDASVSNSVTATVTGEPVVPVRRRGVRH